MQHVTDHQATPLRISSASSGAWLVDLCNAKFVHQPNVKFVSAEVVSEIT